VFGRAAKTAGTVPSGVTSRQMILLPIEWLKKKYRLKLDRWMSPAVGRRSTRKTGDFHNVFG
jgi:hypothetical protein